MNDIVPQDIPQRQCAKCEEWKPLTPQNFFRNKNGHEGFHAQCKPCQRTPLPGTEQQRGRKTGTRMPVGRPKNATSKTCTKCNIDKSLDQFRPQERGTYGVTGACNECLNAKSREYYARRYGLKREPLPEPVNGGKVCRKCKVEKPYQEFSPDKRASDGLGTWCKQCNREREDPERNRARNRAIREREPEKYREKVRNWKKANPLKVREINARRDAIKKNAQVEGEVDYLHILERDSNWCYICDSTIYPDQRIAFDHVTPLVPLKGTNRLPGLHAESNIKVTHYLCNARKGSKLLEEMTPHDRRGIHTHAIQPQLLSENTY